MDQIVPQGARGMVLNRGGLVSNYGGTVQNNQGCVNNIRGKCQNFQGSVKNTEGTVFNEVRAGVTWVRENDTAGPEGGWPHHALTTSLKVEGRRTHQLQDTNRIPDQIRHAQSSQKPLNGLHQVSSVAGQVRLDGLADESICLCRMCPCDSRLFVLQFAFGAGGKCHDVGRSRSKSGWTCHQSRRLGR